MADGAEALGHLVAYGVGAVEPGMFGLGPVPAVRQALERAGWRLSLQLLPWKRCVEAVRAGEIHLALNAILTPERERDITAVQMFLDEKLVVVEDKVVFRPGLSTFLDRENGSG